MIRAPWRLLLVLGCGSQSNTFGVAQPASGTMTMTSPFSGGMTATELEFKNEGTHSVTVGQLSISLADGRVKAMGAGFELTPDTPIFVDFNVTNHQTQPANVMSLTFTLTGETEKLAVDVSTADVTVP